MSAIFFELLSTLPKHPSDIRIKTFISQCKLDSVLSVILIKFYVMLSYVMVVQRQKQNAYTTESDKKHGPCSIKSKNYLQRNL